MDYLSQLRGIYQQVVERGGDIVSIGPAPCAMEVSRFPFALLMDPDNTTRKALGAPEFGVGQLFKPKGLVNYAKSVKAWRQFRFDVDLPVKMPALAILDAEQNVAFKRIGKVLGDYPTTEELLSEVERIAGS